MVNLVNFRAAGPLPEAVSAGPESPVRASRRAAGGPRIAGESGRARAGPRPVRR